MLIMMVRQVGMVIDPGRMVALNPGSRRHGNLRELVQIISIQRLLWWCVLVLRGIWIRIGWHVRYFAEVISGSARVDLVKAWRLIRRRHVEFLPVAPGTAPLTCLVLEHVLGFGLNRPVVSLAWFTQSLALKLEQVKC